MAQERNVTVFDEKDRILDFRDLNLPVPSVGIYDEPVRFYKANLEWVKIIAGFLEWLASTTAWREAENENYFAIQQMLIYLEGVEVEMTDLTEVLERLESIEMALSEMCEDVKCGVVAAAEELAQRILLAANKDNVLSDVAIGKEDGAISIINPPAQPPGSVDASSLELANGHTYAVGLGVREFFSELNTAYLDGLSATQTRDIMAAIYILEDFDPIELEGAIADYFLAWNTAGASYIPNAGKVSEFVWLYGANKKTLSRYALYVQKEIDTDVGAEVFALVNYISSEQIAIWYQDGEGQPRQDYVNYPDYRIPTDSYIVTPDMLFTGTTLKRLYPIFDDYATMKPAGNRWGLKCTGLITHVPSGRKFSAYYQQNASLVWVANTTKLLFNNVGGGYAPETVPPLNIEGNMIAYFTQTFVNKMQGYAWENVPTTILAADCIGQWELTRIDLGQA